MKLPHPQLSETQVAIPYRVFAVDDDPNALEILERHATSHGFRFYSVDDPKEAIPAAVSVMPDVILTDAMMPDISGYDLCQQIREVSELCLVPVVMITSLDGRDDYVRALDAGAQDFLTKPVNRIEFGARIRSLARVRRLTESLDAADRVLDSLALCAEARDQTTGEHCQRLAHDGRAFGEFLGLDRPDIQALDRAGYLHDIGKVAIPDCVLQKQGPLTPAEWDIMRSHSARGADLIAPLATMRRVLPIVRHHHERWDGKGYPDGLAGDAIPRLARIFQPLDAWDALTHERPYKPALTPAESMALLERETTEGRWDPRIFSAFKRWKSLSRSPL